MHMWPRVMAEGFLTSASQQEDVVRHCQMCDKDSFKTMFVDADALKLNLAI